MKYLQKNRQVCKEKVLVGDYIWYRYLFSLRNYTLVSLCDNFLGFLVLAVTPAATIEAEIIEGCVQGSKANRALD